MCNFDELLENPENFQVLQDVDHLNIFVPTGTYSGERLKPIVAICGPMVDPVALINHLNEITNHLVVIEPDFELHSLEGEGQLTHHLEKLLDVYGLPGPDAEPDSELVRVKSDASVQLTFHLAEFIAAQSPVSANEPVVHEFVLKKNEIKTIFDPAAFVNVGKKPKFFINRNYNLPQVSSFRPRRLLSRKILKRWKSVLYEADFLLFSALKFDRNFFLIILVMC